jgi:hypothetical protein
MNYFLWYLYKINKLIGNIYFQKIFRNKIQKINNFNNKVKR